MNRFQVLGLCAVAALVMVASQPTLRSKLTSAYEPAQSLEKSDDPATVAFINVYLTHGSQLAPKKN
jgi:hypothetical protein